MVYLPRRTMISGCHCYSFLNVAQTFPLASKIMATRSLCTSERIFSKILIANRGEVPEKISLL